MWYLFDHCPTTHLTTWSDNPVQGHFDSRSFLWRQFLVTFFPFIWKQLYFSTYFHLRNKKESGVIIYFYCNACGYIWFIGIYWFIGICLVYLVLVYYFKNMCLLSILVHIWTSLCYYKRVCVCVRGGVVSDVKCGPLKFFPNLNTLCCYRPCSVHSVMWEQGLKLFTS